MTILKTHRMYDIFIELPCSCIFGNCHCLHIKKILKKKTIYNASAVEMITTQSGGSNFICICFEISALRKVLSTFTTFFTFTQGKRECDI